MTEPVKNPNLSYEALALLSRLVYEKYGDDVIPLIRKVWYKMGLVSGKRLQEKLSAYNFESAAGLLAQSGEKKGVMESCRVSDALFHHTTPSGAICPAGLENAGCAICEAVMSVNQGQFKSMCGIDVEMNIVRSRAAGDDCCEVFYRPGDTSG